MVYAPGASFFRPKAQSLQAATQTFVGLIWRLTLKYVLSPCIRSRTELAIQPTARMSPVRYRASASAALSRSPANTLSQIGFSRASSVWKACKGPIRLMIPRNGPSFDFEHCSSKPGSVQDTSAAHDHPVLNLAVLVFGEDAAGHQLVGGREGTLRNNAVGLMGGDSGQRRQIIFRSFVQIDSFLVAEPFFYALGDGLGVPLNGSGFFGGLLPDLVGILIRASRTQA